jgi:hypothetical protein
MSLMALASPEKLPGTDSPDMVWKPGYVLLSGSAYNELSRMAEIIP